jgi:hypothetical protein
MGKGDIEEVFGMTRIGTLAVIGLVLVVLVLVAWIVSLIRADRTPIKKTDEKPARGPVSGGVIEGDPGQSILTGEAPQEDEPKKRGPLDL